MALKTSAEPARNSSAARGIVRERVTRAPAAWWACPSSGCYRVVDGLALVRWSTGMIEQQGWMCVADLNSLREDERQAAAGFALDISERVWAVEVVETRGRVSEGVKARAA